MQQQGLAVFLLSIFVIQPNVLSEQLLPVLSSKLCIQYIIQIWKQSSRLPVAKGDSANISLQYSIVLKQKLWQGPHDT